MAKPSALQSLSLAGRIAASDKHWQLQDLVVDLDGARLQGSVTQDAYQHISVTLQGDQLNLDNYLPPQEVSASASADVAANDAEAAPRSTAVESRAPTAASAQGAADRRLSSTPLDLAALRGPSVSLDLALAGLQIGGAAMTDVQLQAQLRDGLLQLQQLRSRVYDGQLQAVALLDAASEKADFTLNAQLHSVALQPLLQNFADEQRLSGQASLDIDVAAQGRSLAAWQQSLKGQVSLTAEALQVAELDIERDFCEMAALLNRKPAPQIAWRGRTELQQVRARLALQGERVTVQQLEAGVEELALSATGTSDYIQGDFDVRGALQVTGAANPDRACQIRDRWRNRDLPLRCRGNIDEPLSGRVCGPDRGRLDALLKAEVKGRVEDKLQEKLQDKLNLDDEKAKQVEQLLRGIFGR